MCLLGYYSYCIYVQGLEFVLNECNASASTSVYIDFQHKLEKYLRGSQLSIEDVCQWIKVNNHQTRQILVGK